MIESKVVNNRKGERDEKERFERKEAEKDQKRKRTPRKLPESFF